MYVFSLALVVGPNLLYLRPRKTRRALAVRWTLDSVAKFSQFPSISSDSDLPSRARGDAALPSPKPQVALSLLHSTGHRPPGAAAALARQQVARRRGTREATTDSPHGAVPACRCALCCRLHHHQTFRQAAGSIGNSQIPFPNSQFSNQLLRSQNSINHD
jgi:hypothetical protein